MKTIKPPRIKPKVKIAKKTKKKLTSEAEEKGQVIVHCSFAPSNEAFVIRIWKTTFLFDNDSSHKSKLLHMENITLAPQWTVVPARKGHRFLLLFSALPKGCTHFDLKEVISGRGGFVVKNIKRNKTDVYKVEIK